MTKTFAHKFIFSLAGILMLLTVAHAGPRKMEKLGRGVVAMRTSSTSAFISWRLLGLDPSGIQFNVYRSANGGAAVKLNATPLSGGTNTTDSTANFAQANSYFVRPVISGAEGADSDAWTLRANSATEPLFRIPLQTPANRSVHNVWVGDLDGDGEYEFITCWVGTATGQTQKLQAYKRDGTLMWEVDFGPLSVDSDNIYVSAATVAAGQWDGVTVFDLDSDGRAEVIIKSANKVTFGDGRTLDNNSDDTTQFISVLDGLTGAERARTELPNPWKSRTNRPLGTLFGIGYPDGSRPSLLIHAKNRNNSKSFNLIESAWDFRGGVLTNRWSIQWDGDAGDVPENSHQIRVIDVDGDGKDDLVPGMHVVGSNGQLLYDLGDQGIGHGDRFHISDLDPNRPGLEGYGIQQLNTSGLIEYFYDVKTGQMIWQNNIGRIEDAGRGTASDVDPRTPGYEVWSFYGMRSVGGNLILTNDPVRPWPNLQMWWDGDLLGENLDDEVVDKWNYTTQNIGRVLTAYHYGAVGNGRSVPQFYGDILGDWREEIVYEKWDHSELQVFTTPIPTSVRLYTLAQNPAYRNCLTVKGYVQENLPDYFLGSGMATPPAPNIVYVDPAPPRARDDNYSVNEDETLSIDAAVEEQTGLLANDTDADGDTLSVVDADSTTAGIQPTKAPAHGTLTFTLNGHDRADGSFIYVPDANFCGSDSFTYQVTDGMTRSETATVRLTIKPVNDPPSFVKGADPTVAEDAPSQSVVNWASAISPGPADEAEQTLTFVATNDNPGLFAAQPVISSDRTLTYAPAANANGTATVTVQLRDSGDGTNLSAAQTFAITVSPVNDAPSAQNDGFSLSEDAILTVAAPDGVLKNDSDIEGDALSVFDADEALPGIQVMSGPLHGTLEMQPDGSFVYAPASNFNGLDSFSYKVSDGAAWSQVATVALTVSPVNDAPVAQDQSTTTNQNNPKSLTLSASDADGDALVYSVVSGPSRGTLSGTAPNLIYTPALGFAGSDSFTFTASDGSATSAPATMRLNVVAIYAAPTLSGFSPTTGPVGTLVTLNGTNFSSNAVVRFNGIASGAVTFVSAKQLKAAVPAGATTGPVSVNVNGGTVTSGTAFKVTPKITGFSPALGKIGDTVTLSGTSFNGAIGVKFNGVAASFIVNSGTEITATVPANATTGKVSLTTPGGTATSLATFTVTSPLLSRFTPTSGPVGTPVTVIGTNYSASTTVKFNGVASQSVTFVSPTQLSAIVPGDATTGKISVVNADGQSATSSAIFTVKPLLTGTAPSQGAVGASVVLTGSGFLGATSVKFNNLTASFAINSSTQITAIVPTNATTGKISVTTAGGTALTANNFLVSPRLASFSPASGRESSLVTIVGANFTNPSTVKFNGLVAETVSFVANNKLTAVVPPGATTGPISVTTSDGLTVSSSTDFKVSPIISAFSPGSGPVGTSISGPGLCGATTEKFGSVVASFMVLSPTQITALVPAQTVIGTISVTTLGGIAASATNFSVSSSAVQARVSQKEF